MPVLHQLAIERCIDRLNHIGAHLMAEIPPASPLSDERQVQMYLDIIADPDATLALRQRKGAALFTQWVASMQQKARLLGMLNANLAPNLEPDDRRDLLTGAFEEDTQPMEDTDGSTG